MKLLAALVFLGLATSGIAYVKKTHKNIGLLPKEHDCGNQVTDDKIVGGNETQLDEFPWMTLLEYKSDGRSIGHECGGILISSRYVVTAAHCVAGPVLTTLGNPYRVRLGEHDKRKSRDCRLSKEGDEEYEECTEHQDIDVEEIIRHPDYNLDEQLLNDISLIRLARPATINSYIQPVCLPVNGERSPVGHTLTVAGWGRTETQNSSDVKRKAQIPIHDFQECSNKYGSIHRLLSDQQFCAGGQEGIDSCKFDSGGPIMTTLPGVTPLRWYVEGIVSYGQVPCGKQGWPGVYTRVSSYVDWILDNMKP